MHPERRRRTEQLKQLADAGEYEQLYQLLMLREFPYEARMGWQLAFLRPFAVPRMADILVHAGELIVEPRKRAYDTGLIIYEIVHGCIDSPRAKQMVSLINRAHHGHDIADVDMTYVLCAFIVTPLRHIDWVGWRPLTDYEKHAAVEFFGRLGRLMNITTVPVDYAEAERMYDAYEASHIGPSPSGVLLGHNLVDVLKSMQPAPLRPFAALVFNLLLADNAVAKSVGLQSVPAPIRGAVAAIARASARVQSLRAPSSKTVFTPGQAVYGVYPRGYQLEELGPHGTDVRKTDHIARPSRP